MSFSKTHHNPTLAILFDEMTMDLTRSSDLEKPGARGVVWTTSLLFFIWNQFTLVIFVAWCSRRKNGANYSDACSKGHLEGCCGWYFGFSGDGRDEGGGEWI